MKIITYQDKNYPTCLNYSALVLFFIICLWHPSKKSHLIKKRALIGVSTSGGSHGTRNGLQRTRRISFNRLIVLESVPLSAISSLGKSQKQQGAMSELYEVWRCCMTLRFAAQDSMNALWIIVMKKPLTNTVVLGIPRSISTSRTIKRRSPITGNGYLQY